MSPIRHRFLKLVEVSGNNAGPKIPSVYAVAIRKLLLDSSNPGVGHGSDVRTSKRTKLLRALAPEHGRGAFRDAPQIDSQPTLRLKNILPSS
jgi:hypothetical protein